MANHTIDAEAATIAGSDFSALLGTYAYKVSSGDLRQIEAAHAALIAHIDARLAAKRSIQPTIAAEGDKP